MKNIHVLPTDKPSRLLWCFEDKRHYTSIDEFYFKNQNELQNQNIYITNDEEIKEGDWILDLDLKKAIKADSLKVITSKKSKCWYYKKIILTTDQSLEGVQAIDDEFLDWFVKNPSCEEVVVIYEPKNFFDVKKGWEYKIIIPKEEPKKVLTEEDIFNQKDIDAVTDYINKKQQKQALINMMKSDEELGLYDDIEINRIEVVCKDCSDSLEDCTCIKSTIDFPKQEIKLEEVFNDDKKENIKKFIDEIQNPSEPNQALKDAFEKYSEYLEDYENKDTYEHGFKDGAKWMQKRSYSEEEVIAFGEFIFKNTLLAHAKGVKNLFEQFKNK